MGFAKKVANRVVFMDSGQIVEIAALHTKHGKLTKAKRQQAEKLAEIGRKVRAEIKQIEASLIEKGVLERNWRQDWEL